MKKTLALILAACMSLSLVACGGGDKSNTPPAGGSNAGTSQSANQPSTGGSEAKTVGIAMPTQSLERWNRDGAYLDEQFKAAGYKTIVTYSDNKNEQQVNDIQNMLSQGRPTWLWTAPRTCWPPSTPTAPSWTPGCAPTTPPPWA